MPNAQGFDHDLAMGRAGFPWADKPPAAREAENNLPLIRTTSAPATTRTGE